MQVTRIHQGLLLSVQQGPQLLTDDVALLSLFGLYSGFHSCRCAGCTARRGASGDGVAGHTVPTVRREAEHLCIQLLFPTASLLLPALVGLASALQALDLGRVVPQLSKAQ